MNELTDKELLDIIKPVEEMIQTNNKKAKALLDKIGFPSYMEGSCPASVIRKTRFGENLLELVIPFDCDNEPTGRFCTVMYRWNSADGSDIRRSIQYDPDIETALIHYANAICAYRNLFGEPTSGYAPSIEAE